MNIVKNWGVLLVIAGALSGCGQEHDHKGRTPLVEVAGEYLYKEDLQAALAAELDSHLAQDVEVNRKNGSGKKTIKAPTGSFELATPRDRNGYFEPQLVKKHQTTLSDELERKIIRLFALGMSYQDISREIEDLYAFSVSTATISAVTDKVIPELKQWQ